MSLKSIYERVVTVSPHGEMLARRAYYLAKPLLARVSGSTKPRKMQAAAGASVAGAVAEAADFGRILDRLAADGLVRGDILLVHGSFGALRPYGLSPDAVIDRLLDAVGPEGTLAMPAIPIYPNELAKAPLDETTLRQQRYVYKPSSTRIWTGELAKAMLRREGAARSAHPLNSMVALGRLAHDMTKDNLLGAYPCGEHSSWAFCHRHDAFVLGLGTDLTHSLTMIHVAEDLRPERWPVRDWYQDRCFIVRDGDADREVHVKERRHVWGKMHFAERTLARDLRRDGVMRAGVVDGVLVESLRAKTLIAYLDRRNERGYPYYWVGGDRRRDAGHPA